VGADDDERRALATGVGCGLQYGALASTTSRFGWIRALQYCDDAPVVEHGGLKGPTMVKLTRGFAGRTKERAAWLPPGQYDIGDAWPVLTAEPTPHLDTATWTFRVEGLVERARTWSWDEMQAFPQDAYRGDIHCVTSWSKHDVAFGGVPVDAVLGESGVLPSATHVLAVSHTGYTTNLPLADVTDGKAWIAFTYGGSPLPREHGGPARLLVPHLYFWKSAKWVAGLVLRDHDAPGFWEERGYHDYGDPWREQRYQGD
jgi:DMSO/TMAO reductase YedYZ molybdopterin-dependent catalytic subunit